MRLVEQLAGQGWDDTNEEQAAEHVAQVLEGTWEKHDDGSENLMFDFVVEAAGRRIALEVTRRVDSKRIQVAKSVAPVLAGVEGCWVARVSPRVRVKQLDWLAGPISELESLGRGIYPCREDDSDWLGIRGRGVRDLYRCARGDPGQLIVGPEDLLGSSSSDDLNRLVEEEVKKNLEKLKQAPPGMERHLFVWGAVDCPELVFPMLVGSECLPDEDPQLDAEIAAVWVVSEAADRIALHWRRGLGWSGPESSPTANYVEARLVERADTEQR